jgi:hypothetical protein
MTMTAAQLELHQATEDEVIDWRFEQLREAGYDRRQAQLLSKLRYVDLHQAIELVERGCTHNLAFAILL